MQRHTDIYEQSPSHRRRQAKRSQKKRIILWGFIIAFAICTLLLGRGLWDRGSLSPFFKAYTRSGTETLENTEVKAPATAEEQKEEQAWSLILVNKNNPIPDKYDVELEQLSNGEKVDVRIYPALQKMFDTARAEGVYPIVASGYRTTEKQQKLMDEKIIEYKVMGYTSEQARAEAEMWVAIPGTSEHQLGIAVDINADGINSAGNEVYKWLDENGYRFGFIRRYPPDKTKITGVSNEPWHYRYVGVAAATEIQKQGLCLEEYLNSTMGGSK